MGTLWVEHQRGRTRALEELEASRPALALVEPSSPGIGPGQPLALATNPIYDRRTKATYVFWMLRDLAGDASLSAALRAYDPTADASKGYLRDQGSGTFEKILEERHCSPRSEMVLCRLGGCRQRPARYLDCQRVSRTRRGR